MPNRRCPIAGDAVSCIDSNALATVDFGRRVLERTVAGHAHVLRWYNAVAARPGAAA